MIQRDGELVLSGDKPGQMRAYAHNQILPSIAPETNSTRNVLLEIWNAADRLSGSAATGKTCQARGATSASGSAHSNGHRVVLGPLVETRPPGLEQPLPNLAGSGHSGD